MSNDVFKTGNGYNTRLVVCICVISLCYYYVVINCKFNVCLRACGVFGDFYICFGVFVGGFTCFCFVFEFTRYGRISFGVCLIFLILRTVLIIVLFFFCWLCYIFFVFFC